MTATIDSLTGGGRFPVVVACSGGRDSVVLADAAVRGGYPSILLGHIDHGLRPERETQADRVVVRELAGRLGVPCVVKTVAPGLLDARGKGGGTEERARVHRYRLLKLIAEETGGDAIIATAHHRGDQAETILMRILAGRSPLTSITIPERREDDSGRIAIIRPLLNVDPDLIAAYANLHGLKWHEDSSNLETRYLRNFVRRTVLPSARLRFPGVADSLSEFGAEVESLREAVSGMIPSAAWGSYNEDRSWSVPIARLAALPFPAIELVLRSAVYRISGDNRLSFAGVRDFLRRYFADGKKKGGGSVIVSDIRVSIHDERIVVRRAVVPIIESGYLFVVPKDEPVVIDGASVEMGYFRSPSEREVVWGPVVPPVVVRSSRPGDRLYRKDQETRGNGKTVVEDMAGTLGEFSNDGKEILGPGNERVADVTSQRPYIRVQFNS